MYIASMCMCTCMCVSSISHRRSGTCDVSKVHNNIYICVYVHVYVHSPYTARIIIAYSLKKFFFSFIQLPKEGAHQRFQKL